MKEKLQSDSLKIVDEEHVSLEPFHRLSLAFKPFMYIFFLIAQKNFTSQDFLQIFLKTDVLKEKASQLINEQLFELLQRHTIFFPYLTTTPAAQKQ